jgi:hypothetical protein
VSKFYVDKEPSDIKEFLVALKKDTEVGFITKKIRR